MLDKIRSNGGGCIFDQTGLGKTITASHLAVNLTNGKINVAAPKATHGEWKEVLKAANTKFHVTTHQTLPTEGCDVLIIDEAHNFKNMSSKSYKQMYLYIKKHSPIVIQLSATPFQNTIAEFRNMLALIPFKTNTPAFITLGRLFNPAIEAENKLQKISRYHDNMESMKIITQRSKHNHRINEILQNISKVVGTFSIRNTRSYISKTYKSDVKMMGSFPKVDYQKVDAGLFGAEEDKIISDILEILEGMKFAQQNVVSYLIKKRVELPTSLGAIMRTFLLKRMDSSIYAFKSSIQNAIDKIEETISTGKVIVNKKHEAVSPNYWIDVKSDLKAFKQISKLAEPLNDNAKLDKLFNIISDTERVVVFTEYNDTLQLLKEEAEKRNMSNFIAYNSKSNKSTLEVIKSNFDANKATKDELKVLFTTDVLAEGANLHRANALVHFDQKWNPSKLVQRNGRINRINKLGKSQNITVYTFSVESIVESIIKLEKRVENKTDLAEKVIDFSHTLKLKDLSDVFVKDNTILFKTDEVENCCIEAYETYMGHVCFKAKNLITKIKDRKLIELTHQFTQNEVEGVSSKINFAFLHGSSKIHKYVRADFNDLYRPIWRHYINDIIKETHDIKGASENLVGTMLKNPKHDKTKELADKLTNWIEEYVPEREFPSRSEFWVNEMHNRSYFNIANRIEI
jgi:superfamily II DNA or RNA helicase